ncbi:hypothetical protein LA329_03780 [Corynebacterium falsenii]|uniref:hypothetical protein n=1 Tax=Corynebacterium falsenii TaxID=108486 RepID=UPI001CCB097A|nr:hypothetical protein [Corynebacterium falsenii]UBI07431.1 hypothetical protein LA329_03780 [Corynebacterium falsenii]
MSKKARKSVAVPDSDPTGSMLPKQLQILSKLSMTLGVLGIIAAVIIYSGYSPVKGDEAVEMNVAVTGVMVALYFFTFALFGWAITKGKTWGLSGLILTHVILLIITYTVIQSGQWWLAIIFGVLAVGSLYLAFSRPSMEWYKKRYSLRR